MTAQRAPEPAPSSPPTVLERILSETRVELEQRRRRVSLEVLQAQAMVAGNRAPRQDGGGHAAVAGGPPSERPRGGFRDALARAGIGVIAEFKRRSPSAGRLREERADIAEIAGAYERGGASALSVLTEGPNFEGSLDDLRAARAACDLPILRKDFIVDPYQLYEARAAGADAVLLIVAALAQRELAALHDLAGALGLDVLVEVHDRQELARAIDLGAGLIGVNNRDLRDFSVDVRRTSQLMDGMPPGAIVVSESGIVAFEQLRELERQGVAAVLVGESLMRASDPARALVELLGGSSAGARRVVGSAGRSAGGTG
jgi:indole-3-glycerol phosphate synthase